jgi:hypothetical protein
VMLAKKALRSVKAFIDMDGGHMDAAGLGDLMSRESDDYRSLRSARGTWRCWPTAPEHRGRSRRSCRHSATGWP